MGIQSGQGRAAAERIEAGAALARDDRAIEVGEVRQRDHGLDDLIALRAKGMELEHLSTS
jgi:hypothetical protein